MARNNSNGPLKFVAAAAVAIVGGIGIGFLIGGTHSARTESPIVQEQPSPDSAPSHSTPVASSPRVTHPRPSSGDYTSPGAPHIDIQEEKTPSLTRVDRMVHTPAPDPSLGSPDPEASQAAPPPPTPAPDQTPTPPTPDSAPPPSPPIPPDSSAPVTTPPAPKDPDYEQIGKTTDSGSGPDSSGKPQFRVQTGAYSQEDSARSVANDLRAKGYFTSTRSDHSGDQTVYHVQIGAYHTRAAANKAAQDLQKGGYPAFVSAIGQ